MEKRFPNYSLFVNSHSLKFLTHLFAQLHMMLCYDVPLALKLRMFIFLIRILPKVACFASGKTIYLKRLLLSFLFLYTFDCFVFCTSCFDEKENLIMETSFYCKTPSRSADDILFFDLINTFFQILGFFVSSSYNMKFKHSL